MTTTELITRYFDNHAGKSAYIDAQLHLVEQAINDSARCLERKDTEFGIVNLAVARIIITKIIETITPFSASLRDELVEIYLSADNALCDVQNIKF